jgi:hypothetical protein
MQNGALLRTFGVEKLPYSFCHFISQYMSIVQFGDQF